MKWTEERVRVELSGFLAGHDEWPRTVDFAEAGHSVLRRMVARYGGPRRWARELGVAYVERRGGRAPAWPEQRVRSELREFLGDALTWPSAGEFERAGRAALWRAVRRSGGAERWALEFGLRPTTRRDGSRRTWTDKRIERELRRFLVGRHEWPKASDFEKAGLASLFTALCTYGGVEAWARRMGLPRRARRRTRSRERYWTHDRIHAQLTEFCRMRGSWPVKRDFAVAGRMPLYWAATRAGGMVRWRVELGFASPEREGASAAA
jgi:hypothetical protein